MQELQGRIIKAQQSEKRVLTAQAEGQQQRQDEQHDVSFVKQRQAKLVQRMQDELGDRVGRAHRAQLTAQNVLMFFPLLLHLLRLLLPTVHVDQPNDEDKLPQKEVDSLHDVKKFRKKSCK